MLRALLKKPPTDMRTYGRELCWRLAFVRRKIQTRPYCQLSGMMCWCIVKSKTLHPNSSFEILDVGFKVPEV